MAKLALLAACAAALASGASATSPCTGGFQPASNYFAGRQPFVPSRSRGFSISYHNNYKKLNVTVGGSTTIVTLSVCGAPLPSRSALGLDSSATLYQLAAPLTFVGITSTTYLPWIELLGARSAVKAIAGASYFNSPCIRSGVSSGVVSDVADQWGSFDVSHSAVGALEAIFRGTSSWDQLGTSKDVPVGETSEKDALAVADWIGYFSAFFDLEETAAEVVSAIRARYDCARASIPAAVTATGLPKVAWGYRWVTNGVPTWYIGSCPNWYCGMVADAGAELLTDANGNSALTDAQFQALASAADVFIYTGADWDTVMVPNLPGASAPTDAALAAVLAAMPAVTRTGAGRRVFDITRAGTNSWFESRPAQPDAMLQDLVAALHPEVNAAQKVPRARVWLRDVFAGESSGAPPPVGTCADFNAKTSLLSDACPTLDLGAASLTTEQRNAAIIAGTVGGAVLLSAAVALVLLFVGKGAAAAAGSAGAAAGTSATAPAVAAKSVTTADLTVREPVKVITQ